uniref:Uncharacterized protein n=1 Tax=Haptolina ericina TaxID=156174 RepID=A0A7S3BC14_9EUKA
MTNLALPLIDIFFGGHEIEMLRYRLNVHASFAYKFVVVESRFTFTGIPKPLYLRDAFLAEAKVHNIHFQNVEFSLEQRSKANCTIPKKWACAWVLEAVQRRFLNAVAIREMLELRGTDALVYVSDIDEILDIDMLLKMNVQVLKCVSPSLRWFIYSERCPLARRFSSGVLFRAGSGWFNSTLAKHPELLLHKVSDKYPGCPQTREAVGWHLSYFMTTADMLTKLRSTSHAYEPGVAKVLRSRDPTRAANSVVAKCGSFRRGSPLIARAGAVKIPPLLSMLPPRASGALASAWDHP